jgi:hypothetical protein
MSPQNVTPRSRIQIGFEMINRPTIPSPAKTKMKYWKPKVKVRITRRAGFIGPRMYSDHPENSAIRSQTET